MTASRNNPLLQYLSNTNISECLCQLAVHQVIFPSCLHRQTCCTSPGLAQALLFFFFVEMKSNYIKQILHVCAGCQNQAVYDTDPSANASVCPAPAVELPPFYLKESKHADVVLRSSSCRLSAARQRTEAKFSARSGETLWIHHLGPSRPCSRPSWALICASLPFLYGCIHRFNGMGGRGRKQKNSHSRRRSLWTRSAVRCFVFNCYLSWRELMCVHVLSFKSWKQPPLMGRKSLLIKAPL